MKKSLAFALLLLAGIVVGPQDAPSINAVPAVVRVPRTFAETPAAPVPDELDVSNLVRERKDIEVDDLFATQAAVPPAPASVPAPAPKAEPVAAPAPPPLPFSYLGRMTKGGRLIVYLQRNQEMVLAETGATLDGAYRVENISPSAVEFVYLPLQARQALHIPHAP